MQTPYQIDNFRFISKIYLPFFCLSMFKRQWCFVFNCKFVAALYERRFGRFSAVIDRRYRAALILPRCLAAEGPEEGADGKENWLENHVEKTTKPPKDFGDFLFDELRDPNKFFTSVFFCFP